MSNGCGIKPSPLNHVSSNQKSVWPSEAHGDCATKSAFYTQEIVIEDRKSVILGTPTLDHTRMENLLHPEVSFVFDRDQDLLPISVGLLRRCAP